MLPLSFSPPHIPFPFSQPCMMTDRILKIIEIFEKNFYFSRENQRKTRVNYKEFHMINQRLILHIK